DPALGARKRRKDAVERIQEITRAVGNRMQQVYCLMDVLEAHKGAGQGLTEKKVEDTLMSVGLEGKEKRGKRVVIAELSEDEGEEDGSGSGSGSEDEEEREGEGEEAPWEGISDTESLGRKGGRYEREAFGYRIQNACELTMWSREVLRLCSHCSFGEECGVFGSMAEEWVRRYCFGYSAAAGSTAGVWRRLWTVAGVWSGWASRRLWRGRRWWWWRREGEGTEMVVSTIAYAAFARFGTGTGHTQRYSRRAFFVCCLLINDKHCASTIPVCVNIKPVVRDVQNEYLSLESAFGPQVAHSLR
ncbi:hypothetical protein LTS18_009520, partial [Coniosporium uncinatum]